MPRIAVLCALLASGCWFDADYRGGHYTCSDGVCPTGEQCVAGECTTSAGDGGSPDTTSEAALTCADPGLFASAGGTVTGSTAGRTSQMSALCGGAIMNGPDAVYRITVAAGAQLHISISGDYAVAAYALAPCAATPATPTCEGETGAVEDLPIVVTAATAGEQFVVVDSVSPIGSGSYSLTVSVP